MAKVRYFKVNVTANQMTSQVVAVPEWEVGVLQAQWGDDAQVIEDETSPFTREIKLPSPRDEFERLAQRYGPKHSDTPFVVGVYGNFGPGVNALADAIVRSTKERVFVEEPETADAEAIVAAAEAEVEEQPVAAGGMPADAFDEDEGGDPEIEFADLAGDVTEAAEAVA